MISYTNSISLDDYAKLRASAGWPAIHQEQAQAGLKGSKFIIVTKDGENAIGIARIVSDGGYVCYLADVLVLPEYQRKGIGTEMVSRLVKIMKESMKDGFQKFGFDKRPNEQFGCGMAQWISK